MRWAGDQEGTRGRDRQQQLDLVRKEPLPKLSPLPALPYNPLPPSPTLPDGLWASLAPRRVVCR